MNKFKITKEDEEKRLDIFLKEKYPKISRSFIQKRIKEGGAKVNGEVSVVHRFLKENDEVDIELRVKNQELGNGENNDGVSSIKYQVLSSKGLDIIAETEDYLVINKPCGLVVHHGEAVPLSSSYNKGEWGGFTLSDILIRKYSEIKNVGEDPQRPGIVHRLDKDVSGAMVIPKTQEMFIHLKKQFQERITKKEYIALVYGLVSKPNGVIDFPIARSEKDGTKMAARPLSQGGREAITEFTVLKYLAKWTLLSVRIKTGRTHQIRVHLNAYGHPIVGDKVYKPKKLKHTLKFGNRLMLHSWKLGFCDLAGGWKEFEAELPWEFKDLI